jgi:hypothetical protein
MTGRFVDHRERTFQLWAYTVGMKRLLLRSTKNETFRTRIDILFQNVKALHLPTSLDGLVVSEADEELAKRIEGIPESSLKTADSSLSRPLAAAATSSPA